MAQFKGTIAWFSKAEGYGFIGLRGRPEVFCDFRTVDVEQYATLKEGDTVEFDIDDSPVGSQAVNVKQIR